jgi:hypothetical protein
VRRTALVVALAALAATAAAGSGTAASTACKAGIHVIGRTTYRVYCGPAAASVKVSGKTHSFRHGTCLRAGKLFTVSIGTLTMSKGKPRYSYLGITVPAAKKDGSYTRAVVTWAFGGKRYSLYNVKVRLSGKRTRGTFSGRIVGRTGNVTGSFRCK